MDRRLRSNTRSDENRGESYGNVSLVHGVPSGYLDTENWSTWVEEPDPIRASDHPVGGYIAPENSHYTWDGVPHDVYFGANTNQGHMGGLPSLQQTNRHVSMEHDRSSQTLNVDSRPTEDLTIQSQYSDRAASIQANSQLKMLSHPSIGTNVFPSLQHLITNENDSGTSQKQSNKRQRTGRYLCNIPNCTSACNLNGRGFASRNDLERHYGDVHHIKSQDGSPVTLYYCPWDYCSRSSKPFPRRKNFQTHLRNKHAGQTPDRQEATDENPPGGGNSDEPAEPSEPLANRIFEDPDLIEEVQYPVSLTLEEEKNLGLQGLFQVASGWCKLVFHQRDTLQTIGQRLEESEQHRRKLEEQESEKEHSAKHLRKMLSKRARTEQEQQLVRAEIARIESKQRNHAVKFDLARTRLAELQKCRDDLSREIFDMSKKARCYVGQLRNKRKEFRTPRRTGSDRQIDSFAPSGIHSPRSPR